MLNSKMTSKINDDILSSDVNKRIQHVRKTKDNGVC